MNCFKRCVVYLLTLALLLQPCMADVGWVSVLASDCDVDVVYPVEECFDSAIEAAEEDDASNDSLSDEKTIEDGDVTLEEEPVDNGAQEQILEPEEEPEASEPEEMLIDLDPILLIDASDVSNISMDHGGLMLFALGESAVYNGKYGNQLNSAAKCLYDEMVDYYYVKRNQDNLTFTPSVSMNTSVVAGSLQSALDALKYDYPQVFWLSVFSASMSSYASTGEVASITLKPVTVTGSSLDLKAFEQGVEQAKAEITEKGTDDRYTIVKNIHDFVCDRLVYPSGDLSVKIYHTAERAFVGSDRYVVCEGYAKAFKILCDEFGIPCILVSGTGVTSGGSGAHMWNYVQMGDSKWYLVDCTWDDQSSGIRTTYLLAGSTSQGFYQTVGSDHLAEDFSLYSGQEFAYPDLATDAYAICSHTRVTSEAVEPDCTSAGKTEGIYCSKCGEVFSGQEVIPALGHAIVTDKGVAETCTTVGKTEGSHCSRCGTVLTAQETIPASGHVIVKDPAEAATCTLAGKTEGSHCSRCGVILTAQKEEAVLGHHPVTDEGKAATCTETGYTAGTYCDRCGKIENGHETIPMADHTYTDNQCVKCGRLQKLSAPVMIKAEQTSSGIKVTWNKVTDAKNYRVYRKSAGGTWILIGTTAGTGWTDTKAVNGTSYSYVAKCVTPDGKNLLSGGPAKSVSAVYLQAVTVKSAVNVTSGVKVQWSKNAAASGYYIYRKNPGGKYSEIAQVLGSDVCTYTDTGVKTANGKTYVYAIRPYKGTVKGLSYPNKTIMRITTPSISSVKNSAKKTMNVKWKKNAYASGYQVRYVTGSAAKTVTVKPGSKVSIKITKLTKGKTYTVSIRSFGIVNGVTCYSAWSTAKKVSIKK